MTDRVMQRGPRTKQQQHSDQEHCEGESSSSAAVKSKVNADRKDQEVSDGFSIEGNLKYDYLLYERTKFGINSRCDCCTAVSRHPPSWCPCSSWSPGFTLWLPGSLGSSCSVCGVAPNVRIQ